jgi:hypothetical protein
MARILSSLLLVLAVSFAATGNARAQSGSYPRVYGPTGRLYGPTQAHYQYQLRYGRQWSGYRGIPGGAEIGAVNGYPRVYSGLSYGTYYPGFGYYNGLGAFNTYPYGAYPYGYYPYGGSYYGGYPYGGWGYGW